MFDSKVNEDPCPSEVVLDDFLDREAPHRISVPASPHAIILKNEQVAAQSSNPKAVLISLNKRSESAFKIISQVVRSPTPDSSQSKTSSEDKSGSCIPTSAPHSNPEALDVARVQELEKENADLRSRLQELTMKELVKGMLDDVHQDGRTGDLLDELAALKKEVAQLKRERSQYISADQAWRSDTNGIAANLASRVYKTHSTTSMASKMFFPTTSSLATSFSPTNAERGELKKSLCGWDMLVTSSASKRSRQNTSDSDISTTDVTPKTENDTFISDETSPVHLPNDIMALIDSAEEQGSAEERPHDRISPPGMALSHRLLQTNFETPRKPTDPHSSDALSASNDSDMSNPPGVNVFDRTTQSCIRPRSGSVMASSMPDCGRFASTEARIAQASYMKGEVQRPPAYLTKNESHSVGPSMMPSWHSGYSTSQAGSLPFRFDAGVRHSFAVPQSQVNGKGFAPPPQPSGHYVPPPPQPTELKPEDQNNYVRLIRMCNMLHVEQRTIDWFTAPQYSHLWPQMIGKVDELQRRHVNGGLSVKNPAAWLTKFFNIIRIDPDEPARNRAMRSAKLSSRRFLGTESGAQANNSLGMHGNNSWYS